MSTEAMTYESAVERLEQIIARLDSNQAGLRETLELCGEGKSLIEFAAGELDAGRPGLQELRLDEVIPRAGAGRPPGRPPQQGGDSRHPKGPSRRQGRPTVGAG